MGASPVRQASPPVDPSRPACATRSFDDYNYFRIVQNKFDEVLSHLSSTYALSSFTSADRQSHLSRVDSAQPSFIHSLATMKLPGILVLSLAAQVLGQAQTCTQEMIASDDCTAVIDANACYNEFRWNAQTLQCIDGKDNADRQRKVKAFSSLPKLSRLLAAGSC